jgi:hypothetical protein
VASRPDPKALRKIVSHRSLLNGDEKGVAFDLGALRSQPIQEDLDYGGVRLRATASSSSAFRATAVRFGHIG